MDKKLMKGKRVLAVIVPGFVISLASLLIVYAYLIDEAGRKNSFTTGETEIGVEEKYDPPEVLKPGEPFDKEPSVLNTGNLNCYVRVKIVFSSGAMEQLTEVIEKNTTEWEWNADGYCYYKKLLVPGEQTKPLFKQVKIADGTNSQLLEEFELYVYAEAVQHDDHSGTCAADEYKSMWNNYTGGQ